MAKHTTFGTALKYIRKQKGMSAEQFSEEIGRSPKMVSKYENGSLPSISALISICKVLCITPDLLLYESLNQTIHEKDSNIHEIFLLLLELTPYELNLVEDSINLIRKMEYE